MSRINYASICEILEPLGWKVITQEYNNLKTEMTFECPQGHRVMTTWEKMRDKRSCPFCAQAEALSQNTKIQPKSNGVIRTLALDQATRITGWSIYDNDQLVKYGTFETSFTDEIARCHQIKMWLVSMILAWRPDFVGLEDIQYQQASEGRAMGVTVFQTLAHLQGILMEACYEQHVEFKLCNTNTWRHDVGIKGKSRGERKRSAQELVKQWYSINATEDEADAICIGRYVISKVNVKVDMMEW